MVIDMRDLVLVTAFIFTVWFLTRAYITYFRRLPLPPGPTSLPIIGNVFDIPKGCQWLTYRKWSEKYGDLVYIHVLGKPMVVISSARIALDLLQKRSSNYSDRLHTPMMTLAGWGWDLGALRYGAEWRKHRRMFHQVFNQTVVRRFETIQQKRIHEYLRLLQDCSESIVDSTKFIVGSLVFELVYGFESESSNKFYIELNDQALEALIETFVPGKYWVDFFPLLQYVPAWMPGASFKRKCIIWNERVQAVRNLPFVEARHAMSKSSSTADSVMTTLLSELSVDDHDRLSSDDEETIKSVTATAYIAGADTTRLTMRSFFLAMTLYPEIQRKAQDELHRVVGPDRLPEFADRDPLVYVNALLKECYRWHPVTPLGLPHRSIADDEYNGYRIPRGSTVLANVWAMLHDPDMYPQPETFDPGRYIKDGKLDPDITDPTTICFGFGRRICPGRHLADSTLFLMMASVLHVFDIAAPLDNNGHSIPQEYTIAPGFLSCPTGFDCTVRPRSKKDEALIEKTSM